MDAEEKLADRWFVRALSHPLRIELLEMLNERQASPVDMKRALGGTLNRINYHLKVLVDCGCVEVIETRPVRGAVKHYYRAVPRSFFGHPDLRQVPPSIRGGATEMSARSFQKVFRRAAEAGNVDKEDAIFNWMTLAVDELGREKAIELGETVLKGYELIAKQSRERAGETEEPLTSLIVGVVTFDAGSARRRP